jgi:hypothetical protein
MKKRQVIQRLLLKDSLKTQKDFLKQHSIFNSLLKTYQNENFWSVVNFGKKLKSLYYLKTDYGKKMLNEKYKEFCYKPKDKSVKYKLSAKVGDDKVIKPAASTARRFLNE